MYRVLFSMVLALVAFGINDPASAQRGEWALLASKKVNMLADRDVIELSRQDGRFNALRITSTRGDINIYRIRVVFGNGDTQDLDVDQKIKEGERTRPIDLDGRNRFIDKIELLYASSELFRRASIEVYGRRIAGSAADGPRPVAGDGVRDWKRLGRSDLDLDFDQDRLMVGAKAGRFDGLQLRARGGSVRVRDLKVVFGNGEVEVVRVRERLRDGRRSKALQFKSRRRRIKGIQIAYQRAERRRRRVVLEIFGQPARAPQVADLKPGWKVIGSQRIDLSKDRGTVRIERGQGPVDRIALRARDQSIDLFDIRVTYGNGDRQKFQVEQRLRPGRQSRPVDLKGRGRNVRSVDVLYQKDRRNRRRASIEVLGRSVDRGADPRPDEGVGAGAGGWRVIGENRRLNLDRTSAAVKIDVQEPFRRIYFQVSRRPVRVNRATVRFKDGSRVRIRMRSVLRPGNRTSEIKLGDRRRIIEGIDLEYERVEAGRRRATFTVFGKL